MPHLHFRRQPARYLGYSYREARVQAHSPADGRAVHSEPNLQPTPEIRFWPQAQFANRKEVIDAVGHRDEDSFNNRMRHAISFWDDDMIEYSEVVAFLTPNVPETRAGAVLVLQYAGVRRADRYSAAPGQKVDSDEFVVANGNGVFPKPSHLCLVQGSEIIDTIGSLDVPARPGILNEKRRYFIRRRWTWRKE
ncbi:hypothetical protein BC828DRAFT_407309 [Blastocladiella britannica]|nr:hypothetical protein BC828DRAFT_407309 [Blastocladiella britannica]